MTYRLCPQKANCGVSYGVYWTKKGSPELIFINNGNSGSTYFNDADKSFCKSSRSGLRDRILQKIIHTQVATEKAAFSFCYASYLIVRSGIVWPKRHEFIAKIYRMFLSVKLILKNFKNFQFFFINLHTV